MKYPHKVKVAVWWEGRPSPGVPEATLIFPPEFAPTPRDVEAQLRLAFEKIPCGYWVLKLKPTESEAVQAVLERAFWCLLDGFRTVGAKVREGLGGILPAPSWASSNRDLYTRLTLEREIEVALKKAKSELYREEPSR
jgi:hypothetical protein